MASLPLLPNELKMEMISWLPLKSIIAIRGLNRLWQHLTSITLILPARRLLLDLFLQAITHHAITEHINKLSPQIHAINRSEYLQSLESGGVELPEEFRVWIREWPSGVLGWMWPGMAVLSLDRGALGDLHGSSQLSDRYTAIEDVVIFETVTDADGEHLRCEETHAKALKVYSSRYWMHWMILKGPQKGMIGTMRTIPDQMEMLEGDDLVCITREMERLTRAGWVDWLSNQLEKAA